MRFIDSDERIRFIYKLKDKGSITSEECEKFASILSEAPTVTVRPATKAEWVGLEYDGYADGNPVYDLWECSKCGCEWNSEADSLPPYCPECGAEMSIYEGEDGES